MKVIAEVGSNFKSINDCIESIKIAKNCGADAVKFQMFSEKDLYGFGDERHNISSLTEFKETADKYEIELMCTGFSPTAYRFIDNYVSTHKIASAELTDTNILKVVNSFRKPVILSTAGSHLADEVRNALLLLKDCRVTIMYCVADYPAKIINMSNLVRLAEYFGLGYQYGYSDHSIDVLIIPQQAKDYGATVIEKHVNFMEYRDTPDAGHSLNESEFKMMVSNLKVRPTSLGEIDAHTNIDMIFKHKRRFICTRPINEGDVYRFHENFDIFRPRPNSDIKLDWVNTFRLFDVDKLTSSKDMKVGEVITRADVRSDHI